MATDNAGESKTKLAPKTWSWNVLSSFWTGARDMNPVKRKRAGEDARATRWLAGADDAPVVWLAQVTSDPVLRERLKHLLSADERRRLERLRTPADQQRHLIGRGLLRILIGAHLNIPAESLVFGYGPSGKPSLAGAAGGLPLHFNVSHSGEFIALAFHCSREVGVDIEEVRPLGDWKDVARQILSEAECRALLGLKLHQQVPAFYRAWTRHEARLKALGQSIGPSGDIASRAALVCQDLALPTGYAGAVAWSPPDQPLARPSN